MDHRMRVTVAHISLLTLICCGVHAFIPGVDGPISSQEALEGGNTTLLCDSVTSLAGDEFMLLVWYKSNGPVYSYDARINKEWSSSWFNASGRLWSSREKQPSTLTVTALREDDQALYHCRVDFLLSPTRNRGINLTVIVLPSQPFFLDEVGNKVENKVGPYHEEDTLVLSCLVIGGRPPPRISWYSGETLVDATDGPSDIPGVKENELFLPLTRENAADLTCRASNTHLTAPIVTTLQVELYLPAYNVSISWVGNNTNANTLQTGKPATVQCKAQGSYPATDLSWWLDHRHLTQHSNQSWSSSTQTAVSHLELTPSVLDNGATLACVATNPAMAPSRGSRADVITLNITYSPIVEVSKLGEGRLNEVMELDPLHLECEARANPPVDRFMWYFNDNVIVSHDIWGLETNSHTLLVEARRQHTGVYSCSAQNSIGETRAEPISIIINYPPECTELGVTLVKETIHCNVRALPVPDTYFWHIQLTGVEIQDLTTGSAILPLTQLTGPLATPLKVKCEASNGVASQDVSCEKILSLDHLRPNQPQQCDIAFEYEEFQMRCIPVENATYYEVTVWRMSSSNSSLVLERRGSMGLSGTQALGHGGAWLVRGGLGMLRTGDEAGAAACNRYGCSRATLLRPTENILKTGHQPWWYFSVEKDVGIAIGAVVLVAIFVISTGLVVRLAARRRRAKTPAPVIQVLQLDDAARDYLDCIGENRIQASHSLRSCSTDYSEGSFDGTGGAPIVDRRRKPRWDNWDPPPPDVTLTLHRESAV